MRSRSVALAVAWRNLHNFFTNPTLVIPALLFPLFFFTAFAGGLSRVGNAPGFDFPDGYTAFQFVFVILQASAFGGVFTGFAIARDFESGFGRRLMLAAPHRTGHRRGLRDGGARARAVHVGMLTVVAFAVGMKIGGERRGPGRRCTCSARCSTWPRCCGRRASRCASARSRPAR